MTKLNGRFSCWALASGYEGDFVVVNRNPLQDIRYVEDVLVVVNNGRVAVNRLDVTPQP